MNISSHVYTNALCVHIYVICCSPSTSISIQLIQGVNTPDSILDISCLTPKDRADLEYMLSIGVDWVALSLFVQRPKDIVEIKGLIMAHNPARMHFLLISWPRLKSQVASMEIHL